METVQPTSVTTGATSILEIVLTRLQLFSSLGSIWACFIASQDTVLGIPELIRYILSHLGDDGRSFEFASEVCWTWRHIALDFLYEGWDDLVPLFRLFGKRIPDDEGYVSPLSLDLLNST